MKLVARRTVLAVCLGGAAAIALDVALAPTIAYPGAQARIGAAAPAFTLSDSAGKTVSLADFKGKTVVLEWTNHDCPYVRKHGGNNMQALQKKDRRRGVADADLVRAWHGGLRLGRE
jgi:cytochrome oxidase Cu insertion factor (SCO1/SenC/PrrC family)